MAIVVLPCALTACSHGDPTTVLGKASSGRLTIGIRFDQPGLAEHTLDGRFVGFDVDAGRETPSVTHETDLTPSAVDMVVATYSITDKRVISFAGPYFDTGQDLLVRRSDTAITGPEALTGRRLCSVAGKNRFAQAVRFVEYPRYPDCVTALLANQVDAVTTDGVILADYVNGEPQAQAAVDKAIRQMVASGAWLDSLRRTIGPSGYALPSPPTVAER
jgi:glutamate transport system substrate-binding protein